ncbi:MAG TPA: DUF4962 domain-containing protein [Candidatus Didemnitutus sp.]|nr:DUF4962 domain-containing protein [Candidatus Didemnitutus sp.]
MAIFCGVAVCAIARDIVTVVPNEAQPYAADPLPALGSNHPLAHELASSGRTHPYLFFDQTSLARLRQRADMEPYKSLRVRLIAHADACLARPVPPPASPPANVPMYLPGGQYNPEFLRTNYDDLYKQSYVIAEVIPTLGFAYQLTGDERYGRSGKEWLLAFANRPILVKKDSEADFEAANVMFGLALGYDWLAGLLSETDKQTVRATLTHMAGPMVVSAEHLLALPNPQASRGYMGGDHTIRTHGLFGLAALALLYELPEAEHWLDLEVTLHRDRLYPSAWAPDGEYLDAWDHFDSSLQDPIPFLVALKRLGGEDLFNNPRLAPRFSGIPRYWLYGLEETSFGPAASYAWLALAAQRQDALAQWLVLRDPKLSKVNEIFAYLFLDPALQPAAPQPPRGGIYWPYGGLVKLCTDWTPLGILLPYRCGVEIGKDYGDQNGIHLRAGGDWVLPRLNDSPGLRSGQPEEFNWELYGWFRGSPAQNVVVPAPDGIADAAILDRTGHVPLDGGIQFAVYPPMKGRHYNEQWQAGPDIRRNGDLRVVSLGPVADYVCGEAHRAYSVDAPALWVRHVFLSKPVSGGAPAYILLCDEVRSGGTQQKYALQLHPGYTYTTLPDGLSVAGRLAGLDVHLLEPSELKYTEKLTPAPLVGQRTRFVQWETPAPVPGVVYLTALVPRLKRDDRVTLTFQAATVPGGWSISVRDRNVDDLVVFRSEGAGRVSVGGRDYRGTAALLRKVDADRESIFIFGESRDHAQRP